MGEGAGVSRLQWGRTSAGEDGMLGAGVVELEPQQSPATPLDCHVLNSSTRAFFPLELKWGRGEKLLVKQRSPTLNWGKRRNAFWNQVLESSKYTNTP